MNSSSRDFIFTNVRKSIFVYSIMTPRYFEGLLRQMHRAPPAIYSDIEYVKYNCPFTFTSLTENLPFCLTPIGGFRMNATNLPPRDSQLLQFHRSCLAVYRKFNLSPSRPWFDYVDDNAAYSEELTAAYNSVLEIADESIFHGK